MITLWERFVSWNLLRYAASCKVLIWTESNRFACKFDIVLNPGSGNRYPSHIKIACTASSFWDMVNFQKVHRTTSTWVILKWAKSKILICSLLTQEMKTIFCYSLRAAVASLQIDFSKCTLSDQTRSSWTWTVWLISPLETLHNVLHLLEFNF